MNKKIMFLLPPSEWKNKLNLYKNEKLNFILNKPYNIWINATEKDLKCSWNRCIEWIDLNKNIWDSKTIEVVNRYSWIMYNSIEYKNMDNYWREFFNKNFYILSWMYWIVKPLDLIWNYKLPIETKGLLDFWWTQIIEILNNSDIEYIINLLPISYSKLIFWKNKKEEIIYNNLRKFKIININFIKVDWNKLSHWVKKIKGEWIKKICENNIIDYNLFWWEVINNENWNIDIVITV
jgi:cytoplasmic iron level regulating protein YaaA (DUF328/UPF0246 family)